MAKPSTSSEKQSIASEPKPDPIPRTTVPVPFKFSTRKPIVNTFSTKFVEEMIARKKQEEEEETQGSKPKPFKAHAVPKSTYVPTNPRVADQAYVEAIRRRLAGNLRKHFQQALLARKSKSMGDIAGIAARPVPLSTYLPPLKLPEYRRARSAGHRAVKLLTEAKSPPNVKEHTIRTRVSTKVRHSQCAGKENHERLRRQPVPDFQKLHAELEERIKKASHMPVTIPRPFRLTSSETHLHRKCKSSSPPQRRSRNIRRVSRENIVVRPTHSSKIRLEAARKRQERFNMDRNRSERFWEDKRDEMVLNRLKVLSSIGSVGNLNEEIERKTAEKRYLDGPSSRAVQTPAHMPFVRFSRNRSPWWWSCSSMAALACLTP
ncbi:unnamed protein product [Angiostrongylus costaricensis]|uniref:TPX2 domain-containing protein n=1 Tax=Angiostrongylus costaricensis TaxID=334426 RepID=A0A158PH17_ANGCS|nr:unnamed protein product [Angiostrongylus costaricensis]